MIWPGIMPDPAIDFVVRVSGPLGAELPDGPVVGVAGVKEGDEGFQRVAIGDLRVGGARARGGDKEVGHVAEVEVGVGVARARAGDNLAEEGGHGAFRMSGGRVDGGVWGRRLAVSAVLHSPSLHQCISIWEGRGLWSHRTAGPRCICLTKLVMPWE